MPDQKQDEETKVEDTTVQNGSESTTETNIDYNQELADQMEKFERAENNREGYQKRKAKTEESVEQTQAEVDEMEAKVEAMIQKRLPQIVNKLQSTMAEDTVESVLYSLAPGNEAKQKLIRFHFENSVGNNGTIRERLENALLISDKKTILKTQKEMAVALQNRQGLSNSGQGSSTEGMEVQDSVLSKTQVDELKAKGWTDDKIQRFKANLNK